jgi:glycine betaine/proline transport system substrate-binding protein
MHIKNPGIFRTRLKVFLIFTIMAFVATAAAGCSPGGGAKQTDEKPIVFADFGWDSALFNNRVAQFIIENGYGYKTDTIPGETIPMVQGLRKGDIDVGIEVWIDNCQEAYDKGIAAGDFVDLGTVFNDNMQGLYVPTYVIKGDPERGIKPMAPGLKTIQDLPKYREVFKDPENPAKGRIYGAVPGWEADKILTEKMETYGLSETYNLFRPGSDAALSTSLVTAYKKGDPWLGYYWEPTWVSGMLDLTLIEEPEYSKELWDKGYACEYPSVDVNVVVHKDLPERAPEVVEFLKKYKVNSAMIGEALAYMKENDVKADQVALWFLKEKQDIWTKWVPADIADKVKQKL